MSRGQVKRRAAAAVELSLLLPMLVFFFVISFDFARIFFYSQTLANCARSGALYGSNLVTAVSPYNSIQEAALAEATDLSPAPSVSSTSGVDSAGNPFVRVTVSWDFQTIASLPGVPATIHLSRTVQMRVTQ
jgi:Flp pilus assembly protein TadG